MSGRVTPVRRLVRGQEGVSLVIALVVLALMLTIGATAITLSMANERDSARSRTRVQTHSKAEGGLAAGLSRVFAVVTTPSLFAGGALNPAILPASRSAAMADPSQPVRYTNGSAYYWGTLRTLTSGCATVTGPSGTQFTPPTCGEWTVTSEAREKSPTPGASDVVRTVSATFQVANVSTTTTASTAWDWLYSRHTGSACDMEIRNPGAVSTNVYAEGNLCLGQTAVILGDPYAPGDPTLSPPLEPGRQVVVKGNLTLGQPQNSIGQRSPSILVHVHLRGGCTYANNPYHDPCHTSLDYPTNSQSFDNVFASSFDRSIPPVVFPPADFAYAYANASPGPRFPCSGPTGTPPTFDTNGVMDGTAGTITLTPVTAYTCRTAAGELSWVPQAGNTPGRLTVRGAIFVDGDLSIPNNTFVDYDGQAVVYVKGRVTLGNGSATCAVFDPAKLGSPNPACDNSANGWNPNTNFLLFVSDGPYSLTAPPISLDSAKFQGGLWATNNIGINEQSEMTGPVLGDYLLVGQRGGTNFPPITIVPTGAPGSQLLINAATTPKVYG